MNLKYRAEESKSMTLYITASVLLGSKGLVIQSEKPELRAFLRAGSSPFTIIAKTGVLSTLWFVFSLRRRSTAVSSGKAMLMRMAEKPWCSHALIADASSWALSTTHSLRAKISVSCLMILGLSSTMRILTFEAFAVSSTAS